MFARARSAQVAPDDWTSPPLTRVKLIWALAALAVTIAPFANDVPGWILPVVAVTMLWRYAAFVRDARLPHVALRMGWAFANFAMVFVTYRTINGLEAGTALLLLMSAMKLTETARTRDLIVIVYMSFFNVVAHALFDQQILSTLYGMLALIVVLAALLQVTRRTEPAQPQRAFSRASVLMAQALPLTLLMFVLFPRVPGPLWALPTTSSSVTGLSESMSAGEISQLLESSAVAFRVEFDDQPPPAAERYWRGPVFDQIQAGTWSSSHRGPAPTRLELAQPEYRYTVTLEPHQRTWVFGLDAPSQPTLPPGLTLNHQLQLIADKPIKERTQFRLRSHTSYRTAANGLGGMRAHFLDTSTTRNPRTRAMAEQLRAKYSDDVQLVQAVLNHFGQDPFAYTLRPPRLDGASNSDQFLFETKRGFCEHYSSSFALLMRYAGIPARVVTGYQGGERNPISGHFTIRQSDAHAWTEVWLAASGWVRIDPTGAVAPERVEKGINGALGDDESLSPLILGNGPLLSRLRFGWDAANAAWNRHILSYGRSAQRNLLRKLGLNTDAGTMVALLTATGIATLGLLALWLTLSGRRRERDPLLRAWHRFGARLARIGLARETHEGPHDYAQRVALARPDLAASVKAIAAQFGALRYGTGASEQRVQTWLRAVRAFRPQALN
ncbi:MAG: DUF3488 and DUF4129 domain-containing transglutaminase family protein [Gammaproteobacteria bacterium]